MATFREADAAVQKLVTQTMDRLHPKLKEAGVTVTVLTSHGGDGPALQAKGQQLAFVVKVTSHKERVAGMSDVLITLDGDRWPDWSEKTQVSIIDHCLTAIVLRYMPTGEIKTDDCGRPKLKVKPHDMEFGVYYEVMQRHGEDALDTKLVAKLCEDTREWVQPLLKWG